MTTDSQTHVDHTAPTVGNRVDAWHRLGTALPGRCGAEEALSRGYSYADVVDLAVGPHRTVWREHSELLTMLAEESWGRLDTAGSLRTGQAVFVTLRLPCAITVGDVDTVDTYLAAVIPHERAAPVRLVAVPVRGACANVQTMELPDAPSWIPFRPTRDPTGDRAAVGDTLGLLRAYFRAFRAEAEKMLHTPLTESDHMTVVRAVFPEPPAGAGRGHGQTLSCLRRLYTAPTQAAIAGTRWAGYQAIAEYLDHYAPVRARSHKATARAVRTLTTSWAADRKQHAYQLLRS